MAMSHQCNGGAKLSTGRQVRGWSVAVKAVCQALDC